MDFIVLDEFGDLPFTVRRPVVPLSCQPAL